MPVPGERRRRRRKRRGACLEKGKPQGLHVVHEPNREGLWNLDRCGLSGLISTEFLLHKMLPFNYFNKSGALVLLIVIHMLHVPTVLDN